MGIPKFYRWLSERYALINQPGGATVVPIIDNFYLDMNGIIHNCTHGNNPDVKLTEDEMIVKIFTYLDKLFHIVKPQKVLFMAIDGVAPRAKMNQQRARRFKSAREAEEAAEAAQRRGEIVPDADSRFDSNCITPGTPFMARLGAHLRFFIRKKISEDPAWQKPTVIFSGHEVPGEGEHKIMEYIRWAKRDPSYTPNTRHCLYGLDADLIMLSLVTHEPHFCLLREVVSYGSGGRGQPAREVLENPCQEHFVLLQIGLLRDYFDLEFKSIADQLPFKYDLERIIDDFVLFCMLVGNDFLPALPTVDIGEGSLDSMFDLYRQLLPSLGGYLTYAGELHRQRFETFMKALAEQEADVLEARANDTEEYENKKAARAERSGKGPAWADGPLPKKSELDEDDAFALEMAKLALQSEGHELELLALEEGEAALAEVEGEVAVVPTAQPAAGPTMMSREARDLFLNGDKNAALAAWRARYYREKLKVGEDGSRSVLEAYIQGLHWVLEYYYRGVASWVWYFPYHYAPMASDFTDLQSIDVKFIIGEPFMPFEQLLAVQPSSSCRLLPEPYRWLMTDANSPIADFYPVDFEIDLEGKRAEWEGVVMIPFIDEKRLLAASRSIAQGALTVEERSRNKLGDIMVFAYKHGSKEESFCASTLPIQYASVGQSNSTAMVQQAPPPLPVGEKGFVPSFVAGTKVGATGPAGFPTLRTLAVNGELRRAGINVFGSTSRKESLILKLKELPTGAAPTAAQVASAVVGQRAWVKWPYLQESLVVGVSDGKMRAGAGGEVRQLSPSERDEWDRLCDGLTLEYLTKHGLEVGQLQILLHVRPCEGLVRQIDGTVEKRFGKSEATYPLQMTLRRNPAPDPRFQTDATATGGDASALEPLKEGDLVMFLGRAHYGCLATVLPGGPRGLDKKGKALKDGGTEAFTGPYRIEIAPAPANTAQAAQAARRILLGNMKVPIIPSGQVARRMGVNSRTLGRMTGNVWVQVGEDKRDRVDVGLCVKNNAKGLFVPDYCAPLEPSPYQQQQQQQQGINGEKRTGGWGYSDAMVRILEQYRQKFPWIWTAVEKQEGGSAASVGKSSGPPAALTLEDVLPGMDKDAALQQVNNLRKWLRSTPLGRRPLIKPTAQVAPETAVRMLQAAMPPKPKELPAVELENVAPALLLPPLARGGTASAFAGGTFEVSDRVVAVGSAGGPTFGSRGTVVGVYDDAVEVLFDQEFLGGTDLFGRCNGNYGALLPPDQLLNLSKTHAVKAEGSAAVKMVKKGAPSSSSSSGAAAVGGGEKKQTMSAAEALAAASAALQGKSAPKPPSYAAAAASEKKPKIPDEGGAKGFTLGRGKPIAPPHQQPPPAAPGSAAGAQLLAQLSGGKVKSAPPMMPPPIMMPPPPPHPGMPMMMMPPPYPPPPPHMMPMMPAPPGRAFVPANALLAQLKGGGQAPPAPPPNPGSELLSKLQQGGSAAAPQSPPGNAGKMLLQQLKNKPADAEGGNGSLEALWKNMQKKDEGGAAVVPPPPPVPSAAITGQPEAPSSSQAADALWKLMANADKKK